MGLPFSLLSGPEQTFGEKAYFCTRELNMSWKSSLILRLLRLQCPASMQQSSPLQTNVAVCKLPIGKELWPMLNHRLCPRVLWDAAGWPGTKLCQGPHQQFGNVDS